MSTAFASIPLGTDCTARGWAEFVQERIGSRWRPDEWNAESLVFTGLLDTSRTVAFTCSTPGCGGPSRTKNVPCYECQQQLKSFAADPETFRRTHIANRRWTGVELPRCAITVDGEQCARTASTRGLCRSHWNMWVGKRRSGIAFEAFVAAGATPYRRREHCRVVGCDHEQVNAKWRLCEPHDQQFSRWRGGRKGRDVEGFLTSARPFVRIHQFSLAGTDPGLRAEIIYVLQRRDEDGFPIDPTVIRTILKKCDERGVSSLLEFTEAELKVMPRSRCEERSFLRSACLHLTRLRGRYDGFDPMDSDVWDTAVLGFEASRQRRYPAVRGSLDFTVVPLGWVKSLVKEWVRQTEPDVATARRMIHTAKVACRALSIRPGGHDPSQLGLADMGAVVKQINDLRRDDGARYSIAMRCAHLRLWRQLVEFGRSADLLNAVPGEFALLSTHRLGKEDPEGEKAGKALPAEVIRFLDQHLDRFRPTVDRIRAGWSGDDYAAMYQTMYVIFRNTGRRLDEVMSLKRDCLRYNANGDASLVYDNRKAGRLGRWLPIDKETVEAVERWQQRVDTLTVLPDLRPWLFPRLSSKQRRKVGYYAGASFLGAFREWRDGLPPIPYGGLTADGELRIFDKALIHTHAFRHTYAQRHADAGTPVDVLKELMDHVSIGTTMGYYQVSLKRKADAVRTIGALTVDRDGSPRPESNAVAYERKSVSVPFGNCTEPSNVKAGGDHCPIRFQCSGCDFYRPDPSFLPAIEEQLVKLRVEREHALTVDAAEWVIRNYDDQIGSFKRVAEAMRELIEGLPDEQRDALDEAAAVLRKTRAARTYLPLTIIDRKGGQASG